MTQPCTQSTDTESLIQQIRGEVYRLIPAVVALQPADKPCYGGWLYILAQTDSQWLTELHVCMGDFPQFFPSERNDRYRNNSCEKAHRLSEHPYHYTSRESRKPEASQYGGAIRLPDQALIISFSGFPEVDDEALLHTAAYNLRLSNGAMVRAMTADAPAVYNRWNALLAA